MTAAHWITAAGTVIAAVAFTLWVNACNRAQQRQLELCKKDLSVRIKPPPHPILNAAKYYGPLLTSIYISVRYLYKDVTNPVPMTRTDVLSIALEIGAIEFMLNFKCLS